MFLSLHDEDGHELAGFKRAEFEFNADGRNAYQIRVQASSMATVSQLGLCEDQTSPPWMMVELYQHRTMNLDDTLIICSGNINIGEGLPILQRINDGEPVTPDDMAKVPAELRTLVVRAIIKRMIKG